MTPALQEGGDSSREQDVFFTHIYELLKTNSSLTPRKHLKVQYGGKYPQLPL